MPSQFDPDDGYLTTFIKPWGRYRYRSTPQGYVSTGGAFTYRFHEIVAHIPNKTNCIVDTLLWAENIEEAFWQAVEWLDTCGRNGITQNPDKFVFGKDTVEFAGFEITTTAVRPCSKVLQSIKEFPTPNNITDIRSSSIRWPIHLPWTNIKEKSLRYRFRVFHIPGVRNTIADALSRHEVGETESPDLPDHASAAIHSTDPPTCPSSEILAAIRLHDDPAEPRCSQPRNSSSRSHWTTCALQPLLTPQLTPLSDATHNGFPVMPSVMTSETRMYHQYREKLTEFYGVILYKDRIVIPHTFRACVLQALHSAHQGTFDDDVASGRVILLARHDTSN